jgi:hypothetical protein
MMADTTKTRLQHVVLFRFPEPLDEADDRQFRDMVASWPDRIGTMSECRVGPDLTGKRNRGYQYLLSMVFPDTDVLAAYVAHPVHQEMVAFLDAHHCERLAFDYYLDETTDFC